MLIENVFIFCQGFQNKVGRAQMNSTFFGFVFAKKKKKKLR